MEKIEIFSQHIPYSVDYEHYSILCTSNSRMSVWPCISIVIQWDCIYCCWPLLIPDNNRRQHNWNCLFGNYFVLSFPLSLSSISIFNSVLMEMKAFIKHRWSFVNCLNSYWFNKWQIIQLISKALRSFGWIYFHTSPTANNCIKHQSPHGCALGTDTFNSFISDFNCVRNNSNYLMI